MTRAPKTLFKGLVALACLVLVAAAGAQPGRAGQEERAPMPDKTIEAVLETHSPRLMSLPGVVGVGDVSGDFSGGPEGAPDGFLDQVCKFVTTNLGAEMGDTEATVDCDYPDDIAPEGIVATDSIRLVPPE